MVRNNLINFQIASSQHHLTITHSNRRYLAGASQTLKKSMSLPCLEVTIHGDFLYNSSRFKQSKKTGEIQLKILLSPYIQSKRFSMCRYIALWLNPCQISTKKRISASVYSLILAFYQVFIIINWKGMSFGIEAIEIYFPKTFVDQKDLCRALFI